MKEIVSGKEIINAILANQSRKSCDWVLDLIAETSQKMYKNRSSSEMIVVPESKKRDFGKLIHTDEVRGILFSKDLRIIQTDYDNFYLNCKR